MLATGAVCAVVAAIAPAATGAGTQAWATTAIPQATLDIAGSGPRLSALSADGRVAVVADPRGVYLFRVPSERAWGSHSTLRARLRVPSWGLGNLSAVGVSSDGATALVVVGAVGKRQASVFVFHASSQRAWQSPVNQTAKLTNAARPAGFGSSVALSSDGATALIGTPGGADVFHVARAAWRDSSTPTATLVADGAGVQEGGVSTAVALSADGRTALIGATSEYTLAGAAFIFRASAADAWLSSATPDAVLTDGLVGQLGGGFGAAVALSPDGTTALVGAPNLAFASAGDAYVFQVRTPDSWATTADPDASLEQASSPYGSGLSSGEPGEIPGWSVALSEDGTALVGEPAVFGPHGAADLSHVAGRGRSWRSGTISPAELTNAASPPRDLFGAAVALSSDGTTALVSSARGSFVFTRGGSRISSYCYVPYVVGEVVRAARRAIESTRCRVGKVSRVGASPVRSGHVISQSPTPGERLAKGTRIDLRVSKGRNH